MSLRNQFELLLLAAIWGASFLFLRVVAPVLNPLVLIELRVAIASMFLLPLLIWRGQLSSLLTCWRPLAVVGLLNSALPFVLFAYAASSLTAGFASVVNATTPMFGALVAWVWLQDRLSGTRVLGLLIGFTGVILLVWSKISFQLGGTASAVLAALAATSAYGVAVNYTKRYLTGVPPLVIATGSQLWASILLMPFAVWLWPSTTVPDAIWLSVLALGVVCTGVAYILFFRLIAAIGPARATAVTFLIPVFGILWGVIWLNETVTSEMLLGGLVILLGTALTTGVLAWPRKEQRA
ncbi:drug/metabolite transporter (DMT)-like permease [Chitinivorax tropicus]|uniref:Drug/metabolite transporter (DMT)-like permease n=1 Tax=Chitinivorax tropicus TaxID=714531 RepID=A0A840MP26_9PROT|nr:DMT family transporter [Chitinivorax tropicus]MBB5017933.1 drug/metabolite transporter (DMT)-like permease [Chitinivorax tropicus]